MSTKKIKPKLNYFDESNRIFTQKIYFLNYYIEEFYFLHLITLQENFQKGVFKDPI